MKIVSFFKIVLGLTLSTAIVVTPIVLAVNLIPSEEGKPNFLRQVINSENPQNISLNFRKTDSFGSLPSGVENTHINSTVSSLIKIKGINENIQIAIDEKDKISYETPKNYEYVEEFQLDLAEAILYKTNNSVEGVFINDNEWKNGVLNHKLKEKYGEFNIIKLNEKNPNGKSKFIEMLNKEETNEKTIDFVIRENVKWTNSNLEETKYFLKAEDFYYSMLQTGLSNNRDRNEKWNQELNPFGGHNNEGGSYPESDKSKTPKTIEMSKEIDSYYGLDKFSPKTVGYPNEYLFPLLGMTSPSELVIPENDLVNGLEIPTNPKMLGNFKGEKTVKFYAKNNSLFGDGIKKLLCDSFILIPAPSDYIKENLADKNLSNIEIIDGWAKRSGLYTYGQKYSDLLYVSPYIPTESNQFRTRFKQNKNYWNKDFVSDENSVKELLLEFSPNSDQNIFSQSAFFQFRNNRVYTIDYSTAPSNIRKSLEEEPNKYGVRYTKPRDASKMVGDLLPQMTIEWGGAGKEKHDKEWYALSDEAAKLWYGSSLDDIIEGKQSYSTYMDPISIHFRSLINAAPNYYAMNNYLYPDGSREVWTSFMPPDIPLGQNEDETFYNMAKDKINNIEYFVKTEEGYEINHISATENEDAFKQNASNSNLQKRSAHFEILKEQMKNLLDEQLGESTNNDKVINIKIPPRKKNPTVLEQTVAKKYLEAINDLDERLNFEYNYNPSLNPWYSNIIKKNGIHTFGGWSADYNMAGSMFTGLNTYGTMTQFAGYIDFKRIVPNQSIENIDDAINSYEKNDGKFPYLARYGITFKKWFESELRKEAKKMNVSDILDLFISYDEATQFKNKVSGTQSGNHGIMLKLFKKDLATPEQLAKYNKLVPFLDSSASKFDLEYFSKGDKTIETVKEIHLIMGNAKGVFGNAISNRTKVSAIVFRKDISVPILRKGITYMEQWRVNQTRPQNEVS